MPEKYVSEVHESYSYDKDSKINYYLYSILNERTFTAYNMKEGEIVSCRVHRIFEKKTDSEYGERKDKYRLVSKILKDFDFELFSYKNMVGGQCTH